MFGFRDPFWLYMIIGKLSIGKIKTHAFYCSTIIHLGQREKNGRIILVSTLPDVMSGLCKNKWITGLFPCILNKARFLMPGLLYPFAFLHAASLPTISQSPPGIVLSLVASKLWTFCKLCRGWHLFGMLNRLYSRCVQKDEVFVGWTAARKTSTGAFCLYSPFLCTIVSTVLFSKKSNNGIDKDHQDAV